MRLYAAIRHHFKRVRRDSLALAALIPKPPINLIRYHGVFAPNSAHRATVTRAGRGGKLADTQTDKTSGRQRANITWAQRPKRVFNIDNETCEASSGMVKMIALIDD